MNQLASRSGDPVVATMPAAASSGDLLAPLYVAWQITNECNLACLHCIEESGPGKAFRDELDSALADSLACEGRVTDALPLRERVAEHRGADPTPQSAAWVG